MSLRVVSGDPFDVPDLQTLVREKLDSGATLQSLQAASGDVVKYQRWGTIRRGERLKEFPEPATLRAMAKALGQTETAIVFAAARSLGLDVTRRGSAFAQRVPAGADDLPAATRASLLELINALVQDNARSESIPEAASTPTTEISGAEPPQSEPEDDP